MVARYNEATAEQTESDREAYTEQAKYVSQFDAMIKKNKIHKVGITRQEVAAVVREAQAAPVTILEPENDLDYSEYMDVGRMAADAVNSI